MQAHVARLAASSLNATADVMHLGLAPPRLYSSLCSMFAEGARPTQMAFTNLCNFPQWVQSASCLPATPHPASHADHWGSPAPVSLATGQAFMPMMPAQMQAALRMEAVQQLICLEATASGQLGKSLWALCYACTVVASVAVIVQRSMSSS